MTKAPKLNMTLRQAIGVTLIEMHNGSLPDDTTPKNLDPWLEAKRIPRKYRSQVRWVLQSLCQSKVEKAFNRGDSVRDILKIARFGGVRGRATVKKEKVSKEHAYRADNTPAVQPKRKARAHEGKPAKAFKLPDATLADYKRAYAEAKAESERHLAKLQKQIDRLSRPKMEEEEASNRMAATVAKLYKGGYTLDSIADILAGIIAMYFEEETE